ncbi:MAG: glycosyltransferase family 4 protein [Prevotella sp.]|nr:glycosyltransferase family 4 protein [Prevotella sp.]
MDKNNLLIGFDAKRIVCNGTGLGSYGRTLVNSLSALADGPCMRLYAPDEGRDDLRHQVEESDRVEFVYSGHSHRFMQDLWRTRGMVADLVRDGIPLYHGLSGELPAGIRKAGIRTLVTIHDLIFLRHPEYYKWVDVQLYKRKFQRTLREADRIVAISECTKRDILHYSNYPRERIDVVYQSCGRAFAKTVEQPVIEAIRRKYGLTDCYILNVGSIEERKNLLLAVKALSLLPERVHLVAIGRKTDYTRLVTDYAERNGLSRRIHLLHGIPNDDLPALYQGARVFVYPSRYEGFGIPIIEAIQSGLPVVAATGSCLEEAGGRDCIYIDPDNEHAMAEAVSQYLDHPELCREAVGRSRAYVRRFENNDIAREMMQEYRECGAWNEE